MRIIYNLSKLNIMKNKLLDDYFKNVLGLKNQAAVAKAFNVGAPTVSKWMQSEIIKPELINRIKNKYPDKPWNILYEHEINKNDNILNEPLETYNLSDIELIDKALSSLLILKERLSR